MDKILYKKTPLKKVFEITLKPFQDFRGIYLETYNKILYEHFNLNFIQDDISKSKYKVLRGVHGDYKTWKLITCLSGSFYLLVVNNNKRSKFYKKWISFILSDKNFKQVLIPPGFGNGHLVLTKEAIFHYKQTTLYDRESQFTIKYNDPDFDFKWPIKKPILSKRDE